MHAEHPSPQWLFCAIASFARSIPEEDFLPTPQGLADLLCLAVLVLGAMEEAQRLAKEKADRDQYNNAVTAGDKEFAVKQYKAASHPFAAKTPEAQNRRADDKAVELAIEQMKQRSKELHQA